MSGGAGKGDTYRKVDPKKYGDGYLYAFGICDGVGCPKKMTCARWLNTKPLFHSTKVKCKIDKYEWYVKQEKIDEEI